MPAPEPHPSRAPTVPHRSRGLRILVAIVPFIAACAPAPFQRAHLDAATADCVARLSAFDAAVDGAGLASADLRRIDGFPALRSDRFRASFRDELDGMPRDHPRLAVWLEHLLALGRQARAIEAERLQALAGATTLPALDALENCAAQVTDWDRQHPGAMRRLLANVAIPDDYRWSARILGLYLPGGAWIYAWDAGERRLDLEAQFAGVSAAAEPVTLARLAPAPVAVPTPDAAALVPAGALLPTTVQPAVTPGVKRLPPTPVFAPLRAGGLQDPGEFYPARFVYRPGTPDLTGTPVGDDAAGPLTAAPADATPSPLPAVAEPEAPAYPETAVSVPMARVVDPAAIIAGVAPDAAPAIPSRFPLPRDVLGIPRPDPGTLAVLFREHAPILRLVRTHAVAPTAGADLPGAIMATGDAATPFGIDTSTPTVYVRHAFTRQGSRSLLQLEYTAWFAVLKPGDDGERTIDGLIWRLTLDDDGSVLLADAIPACGCWHIAFPGPRLAPRRARLEAIDPLTRPVGLPAGTGRLELLLAADTRHIVALRRAPAVEDVSAAPSARTTANANAPGTHYTLRPARELTTTVTPAGMAFFGLDGIVPGTERAGRWWQWTSGIRVAGSPRQWNRQVTAFAGERHFDDANLIERHFMPHSGAIAPP